MRGAHARTPLKAGVGTGPRGAVKARRSAKPSAPPQACPPRAESRAFSMPTRRQVRVRHFLWSQAVCVTDPSRGRTMLGSAVSTTRARDGALSRPAPTWPTALVAVRRHVGVGDGQVDADHLTAVIGSWATAELLRGCFQDAHDGKFVVDSSIAIPPPEPRKEFQIACKMLHFRNNVTQLRSPRLVWGAATSASCCRKQFRRNSAKRAKYTFAAFSNINYSKASCFWGL